MLFQKLVILFFAAHTPVVMELTQPQTTADRLQALIATSAQRLSIGKQVALSKWDSKIPVEDAPREAHVIAAAIQAGELRGLDQTFVATFFKAQIEANKLVQYSLLAEWYRLGNVPAHSSIDLSNAIRPELDQIQTALIAELADTKNIRAKASCPTELALAIGKYVAAHQADLSRLDAIALDRSLATTCNARR
jgi:chorismate mutase